LGFYFVIKVKNMKSFVNGLKGILLSSVIMLVFNIALFSQMNMLSGMAGGKIEKAICSLYPTQGNNVTGTITFNKTNDGVRVVADLQGLTPGKHGFHIHEFGDCNAPDGMSAGGHFNPEKKPHGAPGEMNSHEGDLGNVTADASGKAHYEYTDKMLMLEGPHSIVGRSVIVHKMEDDLKSQPVGNAGARVACGVIGIAK
jgi:superoxide dismutase, Cu-Zn family